MEPNSVNNSSNNVNYLLNRINEMKRGGKANIKEVESIVNRVSVIGLKIIQEFSKYSRIGEVRELVNEIRNAINEATLFLLEYQTEPSEKIKAFFNSYVGLEDQQKEGEPFKSINQISSDVPVTTETVQAAHREILELKSSVNRLSEEIELLALQEQTPEVARELFVKNELLKYKSKSLDFKNAQFKINSEKLVADIVKDDINILNKGSRSHSKKKQLKEKKAHLAVLEESIAQQEKNFRFRFGSEKAQPKFQVLQFPLDFFDQTKVESDLKKTDTLKRRENQGEELRGVDSPQQGSKEVEKQQQTAEVSSKIEFRKDDILDYSQVKEDLSLESKKVNAQGEASKPEVVSAIKDKLKPEENPLVATAPLSLVNYNGTRCYIDSVLEMMLSQNHIREKIFDSYSTLAVRGGNLSEEDQMKFEVLTKLRELILNKTESPVGANSPAENVRKAVFASRLNPDLSNPDDIYRQQDASSFLLLINSLLNNEFYSMEVDTAVVDPTTVESIVVNPATGEPISESRPAESIHKLELRFGNDLGLQEFGLRDLLDQFFAPTVSRTGKGEADSRNFALPDKSKVKFPYTTQAKLLNLPDSLTIHLSRYKFDEQGVGKVTAPVVLPRDGIVDMTSYQTKRSSQSEKYEITGYVVHHGNSLHGGHYTANVKIGDKFFECDDIDLTFPYHRELTAEEFYGNTNAYLIMLKKIPQ